MDKIKDLNSLNQDPRDIDLQYCHFFYIVVNKLVDLLSDKSIGYLKRYLQLVKPERGFGAEARDTGFKDPDIQPLIDTLFFRAIHVYRSGLVTTSAVDFHFRNLFKDNRYILQEILKKRILRICSIGGRLPLDIVALVSVLQSVTREIGLKLDMRVTVLETDETWKTTCFSILSCMELFRKNIWKIQFISSNLPDFDEPKVKKAISEADIVTMVKFYSEFKDMFTDASGVMEKINHIIKPGSLLFFLDFSKDSVIEFCGGALGMLQNSRLVYEELCDLHALDPDAVEKNFYLYHGKIEKPYYSKYLNVFARVWLKRIPKTLYEVRKNYDSNASRKWRPTSVLDTSEGQCKGRINTSADACVERTDTSADACVERTDTSADACVERTDTSAEEKWVSYTLKLTEKDQLIWRLQSRFHMKEKYNPKNSYLSDERFEIWKKKYIKEFLQNREGVKKFVLQHKKERLFLLLQLLSKIKTLKSVRRNFIMNSAVSRESSSGIREREWKKYLTEKRNFSDFKLKIYSFTLDALTQSLEKYHGVKKPKNKVGIINL